ncbi:hypothetical protein B9G53_22845 [Pseudanabaena sp. SR411]|uniref:hypothetical protein n=1 Tax=Pseudanabaena sp. SR411 TaxID=1980935 RepID=UPI000B987BF8|nr:hypothetical protein [Pseudanabaena sp. SR411]OYQ62311.1 hypothetical protein B9G53_22845 [Pseudanabaena sp. SR411]
MTNPKRQNSSGNREDARYIEIVGQDGSSKALLVGYGIQSSQHIIDRWRQRPQESPSGNISASVVDQLSRAIPIVSSSLANGSLFQVVGTPALVEGIKAGTHTLMQTGGASLGTVVSTSTGQIAGQMRFAPSTMAPVIAPFAIWSVLNGIAGTLQLQRINKRLDVMTRKIESLSFRQEADALGRVFQAIKTLDAVLDEYFFTGNFTHLATERLAIAEQEVGSVLERNKMLVENFSERAKSIIEKGRETSIGNLSQKRFVPIPDRIANNISNAIGNVVSSKVKDAMHEANKAEQIATLIQEDGSTAIHDMQLLLGLVSAQSRIQEAHLFYDLIQNPTYVERRMETMQSRIEEHKSILQGFNVVSELKNQAKLCIDEMQWWQKHLLNRSTVNQVNQIADFQDPFATYTKTIDVVPSYCFWRDENGLNIKIDRSGQST